MSALSPIIMIFFFTTKKWLSFFRKKMVKNKKKNSLRFGRCRFRICNNLILTKVKGGMGGSVNHQLGVTQKIYSEKWSIFKGELWGGKVKIAKKNCTNFFFLFFFCSKSSETSKKSILRSDPFLRGGPARRTGQNSRYFSTVICERPNSSTKGIQDFIRNILQEMSEMILKDLGRISFDKLSRRKFMYDHPRSS